MNAFDAVVLLIFAVSLVAGLAKGLVRELVSMIGVVLGILIALIASPGLAPRFESWIHHETAAYAAAFMCCFVATLIVAGLLGHALTKVLDLAHLGFLNRLLGGVFGLVRGVLMGLILALGLTLFLDTETPLLTESRLTPHLVQGGRILAPLLPEDVRRVFLERIDQLPVPEPAGEPETTTI